MKRNKFGGLNVAQVVLVAPMKILIMAFFLNEEEPKALISKWSKGIDNPLASQYAKYGRYYLDSSEAEILPDGRWIVEGTVFEPDEVEYPQHIIW